MQTLQQFKHKHTLQIVSATIGSPQWEGLTSSPSWITITESDTKTGLLADLPKDTLVLLAQQQGATAHHTKDEIVEMLDIKSTELKPYFDDNLVG
jgi:hypothetical protein